ncbi:MAG: Crp/Fnr family transcriptional regulator [Pseudothermotoga sp.]
MEKFIEILKDCDVFADVSHDLLRDIVISGRIEKYSSKELVRRRGQNCDELLFLLQGEAVGLFVNSEGQVLQIDHMVAPKLLASAVIFSSEAKYPVDVETITESVFLSIDKDTFIDFLMQDKDLLRNYLRHVSDAFLFITDKFYEISMKNLVQKVCSYLTKLSQEQKTVEVTMDMTKEELAREFGVTRPALSRVFLELEKLGIIQMKGKKVNIKNHRYIRDYAEFH